jgi:DNA processing protein
MNSTDACIVLNMLPTMGPVRLRKLLQVFETPERILSAKRDELRKVEGVGKEVVDQISNWETIVDLPGELKRIEDLGATVITQTSPSYPKSLREIHAPPIVLYVWGEIQERDHHAIGIIGARRTTHYGSESGKKLAYQLAYAGLTVISGLARGIDTAAHQGALAAKGRTVAVIGSGLSKLYPPENKALAEKICDGNGAVVSEFSMEIEPDRQTFPMRNRIISGWSHGILVVEAGSEQWRVDYSFAGAGTGPRGLRRARAHQCAERHRIEPTNPTRREAGYGRERYSRRPANSSPRGETIAASRRPPPASTLG